MIDDSTEKDTLSGSHNTPTPPVSMFSQGQPSTLPAPPAPKQMAPTPKANVRLASSQKELALPEGTCNIGMSSVEVPDEAQQIAGFYVDDPGLLVGQFRQYKFIQEKGQANDQSISL